MISFVIHGEPVAKQRPRFNRFSNRAYTPDKTIVYENLVKMEFLNQVKNVAPYEKDTPLSVKIDAYFSIPKSVSMKKHNLMLAGDIRHTKKPDTDNLCKSILDGLRGVAFVDDCSVVELTARKWYADNPRVSVRIKIAEPPMPFDEE